jgi:hypothetical protein
MTDQVGGALRDACAELDSRDSLLREARAEIEWLRAELRGREAALDAAGDGWQPIETAPRSTSTVVASGTYVRGEYILSFCPDESAVDPMGCICVVWWEPHLSNGIWMGEAGEPVRPTHWRPLPLPPRGHRGDHEGER